MKSATGVVLTEPEVAKCLAPLGPSVSSSRSRFKGEVRLKGNFGPPVDGGLVFLLLSLPNAKVLATFLELSELPAVPKTGVADFSVLTGNVGSAVDEVIFVPGAGILKPAATGLSVPVKQNPDDDDDETAAAKVEIVVVTGGGAAALAVVQLNEELLPLFEGEGSAKEVKSDLGWEKTNPAALGWSSLFSFLSSLLSNLKPLSSLSPPVGGTKPNLKPWPDEFPVPDPLFVESSCEDGTPNLKPLLGALDKMGPILKPEETGVELEVELVPNLKPVATGVESEVELVPNLKPGVESEVELVPNLKAEEIGAESLVELGTLILKPVEVMTPNFGRTSTELEDGGAGGALGLAV